MAAVPEGLSRVLVVDDNPAKRYAIARLLRAAGFVVSEAGSGKEALDQAEEAPDAIVLDVNLPDIDG
jgi:CheY-like chemotaxis protein